MGLRMKRGKMLTLDEVSHRFGVPSKWLAQWLNKYRVDCSGRPFFLQVGMTKLFRESDVERLLRDDNFCLCRDRKMAQRPDKEELIYFISNGNFVKIGYTASVKARIKKMLTDTPFDLVALHVEAGTRADEKRLHKMFKHLRVKREWFKMSDDISLYIESRKAVLEIKDDI